MSRLPVSIDRLRLVAEVWLYRHGPWWLLLGLAAAALLTFAAAAIPALDRELAAQEAILNELRARLASGEAPPPTAASTSLLNYQAFRDILADDDNALYGIKAVLDLAQDHRLTSTRAEYVHGRDASAEAGALQMTLPLRGRYGDVRRWLEEVLLTQPFVAVNEMSFKREEIGLNQIEAKVRLTLWHRLPQLEARADRVRAHEVDP